MIATNLATPYTSKTTNYKPQIQQEKCCAKLMLLNGLNPSNANKKQIS